MNQTPHERRSASGRIAVETFEPRPWSEVEGGPTLNLIHVVEHFEGDIQGRGEVYFIQAQRADGAASFVGQERVEGSLAGRTGTFVLQDSGTLESSQVRGTWFVVPGSGTGELEGIRGEGGFEAELGQHAQIRLDYWFE
jgi:Protein of unknown function (DUF3224)